MNSYTKYPVTIFNDSRATYAAQTMNFAMRRPLRVGRGGGRHGRLCIDLYNGTDERISERSDADRLSC